MRCVNVGSDAHALEMGDFGGGALFDGDVLAVGDGKIEGGDGRGDVEGHVVFLGEDSDLVGAYLVGGVAVGRDAVGAGDDGSDLSGLEEVTDHVVGDERKRNAALVELPGGEARALEIRARFGHEDVNLSSLFECNVQYAERGAHGGGDADGGSAADDHFADGFGDVAVVGVGVGDFLGGKAALVE